MATTRGWRWAAVRRSAAALALVSALPMAVSACASAAKPPSAPNDLIALPGGSGVLGIFWTQGPHPERTARITVTAEPGGRTCATTTAKATLCTITGLHDGRRYTVRAQAHGPGGSSKVVTSASVIAGTPLFPSNITTEAGDTGVLVSWSPPPGIPNAPITYTVTAKPGGNTCQTPGTSCTVGGLTNGTPYRFTVVASNTFGPGLRTRPTLAVTPSAIAGATQGILYLGPLDAQSETTSTTILQRDAGLSVTLPNGRDLWIFGDTSAFSSASSGSQFIGGSTAAKGTFRPGGKHGLTDVHPARSTNGITGNQFLPTPTDTYLPDGSGRRCDAANGALYAARWPTGATLLTDQSLVLITYTDVCVLSPDRFQVEGWGFVEYQWRGGKIRLGPVDVFPPQRSGAALPDQLAFQSPVVSGGKVTLFVSSCTSLYISCTQGVIATATLPDNPFALVNPAFYRPVPLPAPAAGPWTPVNISVSPYSATGDAAIGTVPVAQYRLVEQTSIAGTFAVYASPTPTGPWSPLVSGTLPGCNLTPQGFCYAFVGHPSLSGKRAMVLTYFKPDSEQNVKIGHVVVASVLLQDPLAHKPVVIPAHY